MFGWLSAASACASRSKRASRSGVGQERRRQDLQSDVPIELGVSGAVDLAHATGADGGDDLVRTEPGSGSQRHGLGRIISPVSSSSRVTWRPYHWRRCRDDAPSRAESAGGRKRRHAAASYLGALKAAFVSGRITPAPFPLLPSPATYTSVRSLIDACKTMTNSPVSRPPR